jgi:hypothetical protein
VIHHRRDACHGTPPGFAARIEERLTRAPAKKLLMVDGGSGAYGDPCEPMHWHGFIGMEQQVVDEIAGFIREQRLQPPR